MGVRGEWHGCAIACSLRSLAILGGKKDVDRDWNDHSALADALGIPLVLARLEDVLFEGMSEERRPHWPERFAGAIAPGADLSGTWDRLAHWLLVDQDRGVLRLVEHKRKHDAAKTTISDVAKLYERRIAGDPPTVEEWETVSCVVTMRANAVSDSDYAVYAAAASAASVSAYDITGACDFAGVGAADSVIYASVGYAEVGLTDRRGYYDEISDKLIELLQEGGSPLKF